MSVSIAQKLSLLRDDMKNLAVDGVLIPHTDEFGSEYLPPSAERLAFITGFTGSSGAAIVLKDKAMAMTDGRYTIQMKHQVDGNLFELCDMASITLGDWLVDKAEASAVIGYDPQLYTKKQVEAIAAIIAAKNMVLKPLPYNVIDKIWTDRPVPPVGVVETFPDQVAGATSFEKRSKIAAQLAVEKIDSCVITLSDSICWLLNIRGSDIDFNPLVLSYAVLHKDASVDWFVNEQKVPSSVRAALGGDIRLHPFEGFAEFLKGMKGAVQYDDARSSMWVYQLLSGAEIVMGKDPCIMPKACKTAAEQLSLKQAHIRDGVAITRFLFWFEAQDLSTGQITELVVEEKLEEFRRANRTYRGPCFSTIAGWAEHGAIIHYRATPQSNKVLTGNSFLLLDSGAQYEYGTTDITRTIVAGDVTPEMKDRYTRVLKGHIALARARFSPETDGATLDALARQYLVEVGLNFAHGTGHGVGCFMCVHEEASSISPRGKTPFKPGMLVSNEPGYYLEGGYGIRHENLILCQEDEATGEYYFETVTVAPFDLRGIDWDLITDDEKQWLDDYHRNVFDTLSPFLDELELQWLEATLFPKEKVEPTEEEIAFSYSAYD